MTQRSPVVRKAEAGKAVAFVGDVYRFLVTGAETGGKYALFEALVPPGGGPPPHVHTREEEGFYVLEGEMTFYADGRKFTGGPGTFVNLPIGSEHRFHNESGRPVKMLISVTPAGFEDMFFEVGVELPPGTVAAPPPGPDEIAKLIAAAPRYGVTLKLPPH